jgi:trehalose 6-phosphate synthase
MNAEIAQLANTQDVNLSYRNPGLLYAPDGGFLPPAKNLSAERQRFMEPEKHRIRNLIFASWRLPEEERDGVRVKMTGGLAHAAMDFFHDAENDNLAHGLMWVGCLGGGEGNEPMPFPQAFGNDKTNGVVIDGFTIDPDLITKAYLHKANEEDWFLHHMDDDNITLHPELSSDHREFDRLFAERIAGHFPTSEDFVWMQDYQLPYAAEELRKMQGKEGEQLRIGIHWHIPWAEPKYFRRKPQTERRELLQAMLSHDIIGLQERTHRDNLVNCIREFLGNDEETPEEERPKIVNLPDRYVVWFRGRKTTIKHYPISVSPNAVRELAATDEALEEKERFEERFGDSDTIIQVNREEPEKKYLELIRGVRQSLRYYPELRGDLKLNLVVGKGRELQAYRDYAAKARAIAEEVNTEFSQYGQVIFIDPQLPREKVIGRMSGKPHKLMVLNSKQEGMGLTIKEAAVVAPEDTAFMAGIHTGAYQELHRYMLGINDANNADEIGHTVYHALRCLSLWERMALRSGIQNHVENNDIKKWFTDYMNDALAT